MIQVQDFHKSYQGFIAVHGLSFQVNPGEVLGLIGPNGAGKTTTLRSIAGIIPPTQGTIHVCGHDIEDDPIAAKQQLAYIPDDPHLFDSMSVWEHFQFIASAYNVQEYKEYGEQLLTRFALQDKRNTFAQELSRGMKQKVALGCAYIHHPKVIIFDEPLTGLDPRAIRDAKDSIKEKAQEGASIIISSHLLSLVEDLCSHLLILHKGECRYFGSLSEARRTLTGEDKSLEDVFFELTESPQDDVEQAVEGAAFV